MESLFTFASFFGICSNKSVIINEIANPILGFTIYNPDKKEVEEFSRCELQTYANLHWILEAIRSTLMVLVTISQLDIALLRVMYGEMTSFYTIRMLLNEKKFPEDNKSYQKIEEDTDGIELV